MGILSYARHKCVTAFIKGRRDERGFSLIEAAIGLTILGLITLPIIKSYTQKQISAANLENRGTLSGIQKAINQHVINISGTYPCPADLTKKEGDSGYGEALADCSFSYVNSHVKNCNSSSWLSSGGICKTNGPTDNAILIGGVPFATIKIHPEASTDYWGNKIIYAVTYSQTKADTFETDGGKIEIMSVALDKGDPPITLSALYDTILFSTGASAVGGFSSSGVKLSDCGDPDNDGYDNENCDFDRIFFLDKNPDANSASARSFEVNPVTQQPSDTFYDDYTLGQRSLPEFDWFQHNDNPTYVDKDYLLTLANRIGIGTTEPEQRLHVVGKTYIESDSGTGVGGWLKTDEICNEDGSVCFDPEIITGNVSDMQCDSGSSYYGDQAVKQLAFSQVTCSSGIKTNGSAVDGIKLQVDTTLFDDIDCSDTSQLAAGFDSDGKLSCVTAP